MKRIKIFLPALIFCSAGVSAREPGMEMLDISTSSTGGVIPAELENPTQFCLKIKELLAPVKAEPGKLKRGKPGDSPGPVKERQKMALEREAHSIALCDTAIEERKRIIELQAVIAKDPANTSAQVKAAAYYYHQAALLEKMAMRLYFEAKTLRAKNASGGN